MDQSKSTTEQIAHVRDALSKHYAAIADARDVLANISFSEICIEFGKNDSTKLSEHEIDRLISGNNIDHTEQRLNETFAAKTNHDALLLPQQFADTEPQPPAYCLKTFFTAIGELRANMNSLRKSQTMISQLNASIGEAIATDEKRVEVIQNHLQQTVPIDTLRSAEKLVLEMEMLMEP